jgi:hypothetical protein
MLEFFYFGLAGARQIGGDSDEARKGLKFFYCLILCYNIAMRNISRAEIKNKKLKYNQSGSMLVLALAATGIFLTITVGAVGLATMQRRLNITKVARAQAIHIAEAGVNYYRWVLYHDHEEYCNKETCVGAPDYGPYGPYAYTDSGGQNIIGYYELYITPPPPNGSTIVTVKSVGWTANYPNVKREIEVRCGIPSWSAYSTLADDNMRFGQGTETWGPIHSNYGIRFDGIAHNVVSSSLLDYEDPDHDEDEVLEFGVHTHDDVGFGTYDDNEISDGSNPPNPPAQSDIFLSGRSFPEPTVSFDLLDNYINTAYASATTSGIVFDPRSAGTADPDSEPGYWGCINSSCDEGFHITFKTNNTFDIREVSKIYDDCKQGQDYYPLFSIQNEGSAQNFPIPANGLIFVKNHLWVDGQINGSRVTILAFMEPFTGDTANITINNDLTYTNYDSLDAIGLIAQNDIGPGLYSEDDLRVDAALIAKSGRIGRTYYPANCDSEYHKRNIITVFGSLATNQRYGFSWACGESQQWCSGYNTRSLIYDNNLTFFPPPHFPTTGEYTFISWKEK